MCLFLVALVAVATPLSSVYSSSKFALEAYSDGLRREIAAFNISVSVIKPAYVKTPIFERGEAASAQVPTTHNSQSQQTLMKGTVNGVMRISNV
jgi:short-subunit dehydrogenase